MKSIRPVHFHFKGCLVIVFFFIQTLIGASAWDFQQCGMCDQQSLRSACAYTQPDQSLCYLLEYSMIVKLLTEHHLEFLSFKGGCTGLSKSTHVKMPHCWKSQALAHRTFWKQTNETLIRCCILLCLAWVSTVFLCPIKRRLGLYGLAGFSSQLIITIIQS